MLMTEFSVQVSSVRHKSPPVTNDGTAAPRSNEVERHAYD
jgi:hypothetical protein